MADLMSKVIHKYKVPVAAAQLKHKQLTDLNSTKAATVKKVEKLV